ncbi:hypothetical protein [Rhodospira trueperi]|uniref:Uncharacterized protein n=1 Tax=Rhodospira trueperi TaxID=69960 RepID=A0A1G6X4R3_9PROT|nr:hypothetical protein [Rhodospira trueperi]SDD72286.1 hypothetical protein SAMN05421720_101350 [Rhodospira trueperi]
MIDPTETCDPLLDGAHAVLASPFVSASSRELARRVIAEGGLPRLPDRGPRRIDDVMRLHMVGIGFAHLTAPHASTRARALALVRTEAPATLAMLDAPADPAPFDAA